MDEKKAAKLFERIGYRFCDQALFRQAMAHRSYANENPDWKQGNNERLEFLGDAVLELAISEQLITKYPDLSEGDLSKLRAQLVSETSLADIARGLELGQCLYVGRGEAKSGGREKNSILSDSLEALLAAVYLDSREKHGIEGVGSVIRKLFAERMSTAAESSLHSADYKTELQELVQKRYKDTVQYNITREAGPDHEKQFETAVTFRDREFARGTGRSKKQAEQAAAQNALRDLRNGTLRLGP